MAAANDAKQLNDADVDDWAEEGEVQGTLGDMVPDQDDELEELVGRYLQSLVAKEKAEEKAKALKADIREAMISRELTVYHCRTAGKKVTANKELTVKIVNDKPDGKEG
jgi:hypothetical protein